MSHKQSDTLELWSELRERNTVTVVFETFLFTLAMILSLFGNLMVCYAVRRNPGLCRRPSNYYIISLALTDISLALSTMPWSVILLATGKWPFGTFLTYFATISKLSLTNISVWTMVLMALNRYYKIVKPTKYQCVFTKKFIVSSALAVWATFIVISLLFIVTFRFSNHVCPAFALPLTTYEMPISLPTLIFITFLPYPIVIFCYWKVYWAIKMHNANISWQNANVEDVRVAKILFITVVGFVSLWLPAQIIYLVSYHRRLPRQLTFLATLFIFSSSFINPFIYGFMNRSFRNEFKKCLILKTKQSVDMELSHRKPGPV